MTIPQRLRDIAGDLNKAVCKEQASMCAGDLLAIAAELEAPAAEGSLALASESRRGSVAFRYLREEVARAMAPVYAAFANQTKAEKPAADVVPVVAWEVRDSAGFVCIEYDASAADAAEKDGWGTVPLIRQRDAQATIATRDARIAELEAALLACARKAEALKMPCGMDPESAQAVRNARYQDISTTAHIALGTIRGPRHHDPAPTSEDREPAAVLSIMKLLEQYGGKRSELSACQIIGGMDAQFKVAQECSNLHNQIHDALCELVKGTAADAARECEKEIDSMIKYGPLQGNGLDETARRNGLILAANAISAKFGVKP
jgi:hypothetical protein